jgi:glutamate 5-kinase
MKERDVRVILVSSGAIGAGMGILGYETRPRSLPELQAAASAGQSHLMRVYADAFGRRGFRVAQVLLTHDDLRSRTRHLNARNTMLRLLDHDVVPIANENDAVAVAEIQFGDNDRLAALVCHLVQADVLIILSVVPGLLRPSDEGDMRLVPEVRHIDDEVRGWAGGPGSDRSVGGMLSKVEAADMVTRAGEPVVIASGREPHVLRRILDGEQLGTLFHPDREALRRMPGRDRWIAYFHRSGGSILVDTGARRALQQRGSSLLPSGVVSVEGAFGVGDVVEIADTEGAVFARGLSNYDAKTLGSIRGKRTADVRSQLGPGNYDEVVHRDNLVLI